MCLLQPGGAAGVGGHRRGHDPRAGSHCSRRFDCGALPSTHDYHLGRFLFEFFPESKGGTGFPYSPAPSEPVDLPLAAVAAFSIDDAHTTEIDDAFSVQVLPGIGWRVGIHIAAPGLGILPGSPLDGIARERLIGKGVNLMEFERHAAFRPD